MVRAGAGRPFFIKSKKSTIGEKLPMRYRALAIASLFAATAGLAASADADTINVGVIASFTGPSAQLGDDEKQAVELAMAEVDGHVGSHKINVIYRDVGGNNPARAKQLTQELIVRDNIQYLAGLEWTPTVLALADIITEAKLPYVIFNSGTSLVTQKSPFYVRPGFTEWQVSLPLAQYAAQHGCKTAAVVGADYAPFREADAAFHDGFEANGGKIVAVIPVPLGTADFSSYIEKVRETKPNCTLEFMPGGAMVDTFVRTYDASGLRQSIPLYGGTEIAQRFLPDMGPGVVGIVSASFYSPELQNPANRAFVQAFRTRFGADSSPDVLTVSSYDAMKLIFHMVAATDGRRDGVKAIDSVKGFKWLSPRGPVEIDPTTRDIVQNIYIRRVEKENGHFAMPTIATIPNVRNLWKDLGTN
jgi:branched-chain amino acid transport system substrate-binding protein